MVPLQGAIVVGCWCDDRAIAGCPWHPTQQWHPEKASRKTALNFCRRYIVLYIDNTKNWVFAIWVYVGIIFLNRGFLEVSDMESSLKIKEAQDIFLLGCASWNVLEA